MDIAIILQVFINGVLFGTMYGIGAIGLSLIYGTMRIIFLAQGTLIILAAYGSFYLFSSYRLDPYLSLLLILPLFFFVGTGLYQSLFRKVARESQFTTLLIAFGLLILLENSMSVVFTTNTRALQTGYAAYAFKLFGFQISFVRFIAFIMALIGTGVVTLFLKKTLIGKAVRAASENIEYAMLVGINPHIVNTIAFGIGIGLAGMAGVAVATTYAFDPFSGFIFSLKAMIALALGGMGSVLGAFLGGVLLGVVESYGSFFITSGWADVISYLVFLCVLLFKPEGLFSHQRGVKL